MPRRVQVDSGWLERCTHCAPRTANTPGTLQHACTGLPARAACLCPAVLRVRVGVPAADVQLLRDLLDKRVVLLRLGRQAEALGPQRLRLPVPLGMSLQLALAAHQRLGLVRVRAQHRRRHPCAKYSPAPQKRCNAEMQALALSASEGSGFLNNIGTLRFSAHAGPCRSPAACGGALSGWLYFARQHSTAHGLTPSSSALSAASSALTSHCTGRPLMLPTLQAAVRAVWHPDLARPSPAKLCSNEVA